MEYLWNVGAEGGYFVADKFAVKVGLGYGDFEEKVHLLTN
jgi:hypothetical protein